MISKVGLLFDMKRFNVVDINKTFEHILDSIRFNTRVASSLNYGGVRTEGLGKINSSFFSFVFLCGGNVKEFASRDTLKKIFLKKDKNIKIIISEDLAKYKGNLDLLVFEATLEAISKMILIPVESFGTACELGAFTRMRKEDNKVVAIIDKNRAKDNSFINYGPIEYLRNIGTDRVYTATFTKRANRTYLCTNSKIRTIGEHDLIQKENRIVKYFSTNNSVASITDLFSFFVAVIDLACLVEFVTVDFIFKYFYQHTQSNNIILKTPNINCGEPTLRNMVYTLLNILVSMGFLKENNGLYFVEAEKFIAANAKSKDRWIGKVLFTVEFTRTDEYLKIKSLCSEYKRKIQKYGYR